MKGFWKHWRPILACLAFVALAVLLQSQATSPAPITNATTTMSVATPEVSPWKYLAAALAVGMACIGGGIAVGRIGAAAMGAMSEKPELASKAIPFAGLAEGICLWGFLVAMLILFL